MYSPKGGLWFSILLRPDIPTNRVSLLQFLTANATRQALADESEISIKLKWPNDLVTKSGKIGGILIESKSQGDRMKFTVVGIGLNINQRKTQLPLGATSLLLETGLQHNRRNLLRKILEQLRSSYDDIDDPSTVMGKWWQYCIHRPPRVQVTLQGGVVSGITRGVDEDGSLTVETDDRRVQKVSDGTLRVLDGFSR